MMKSFLFISLVLTVFCEQAFAQVMDMRAFSRQRGFRAYQAPAPEPVSESVYWQSEEDDQEEDSSPFQYTELQEQTRKTSPQIQQKGLKIFQEKDEDKVMNFDIENPEFKKLNKQEQRDLLNRIRYEDN